MRGGREQVGAVCLKDQRFSLSEDLIDGMSNDEQYRLVKESLRIFIKHGKAEFPLLLKFLGIDLKSGQRLIDYMERKGFVGLEKPDRSRNLLITKDRFEELFGETVAAYMHLDEQFFEEVAAGNKTVELRVNDCKRKTLKVGDRVEFVGPERCIRAEITRLESAQKFSDLNIETLNKAGLKNVTAGEVDNFMRRFYSKKDVAKYGVVAISFKPVEVI